MTAEVHRESATIYAFKPRTLPRAERFQGQTNTVVDLLARRYANHVDIDAWYHAEAVKSDGPTSH